MEKIEEHKVSIARNFRLHIKENYGDFHTSKEQEFVCTQKLNEESELAYNEQQGIAQWNSKEEVCLKFPNLIEEVVYCVCWTVSLYRLLKTLRVFCSDISQRVRWG